MQELLNLRTEVRELREDALGVVGAERLEEMKALKAEVEVLRSKLSHFNAGNCGGRRLMSKVIIASFLFGVVALYWTILTHHVVKIHELP